MLPPDVQQGFGNVKHAQRDMCVCSTEVSVLHRDSQTVAHVRDRRAPSTFSYPVDWAPRLALKGFLVERKQIDVPRIFVPIQPIQNDWKQPSSVDLTFA